MNASQRALPTCCPRGRAPSGPGDRDARLTPGLWRGPVRGRGPQGHRGGSVTCQFPSAGRGGIAAGRLSGPVNLRTGVRVRVPVGARAQVPGLTATRGRAGGSGGWFSPMCLALSLALPLSEVTHVCCKKMKRWGVTLGHAGGPRVAQRPSLSGRGVRPVKGHDSAGGWEPRARGPWGRRHQPCPHGSRGVRSEVQRREGVRPLGEPCP